MEKLLPEFQAIVDVETKRFFCDVYALDLARNVALECQALALRVPEISDAEIALHWHWDCVNIGDWRKHVRAVLAAYEAKRFAPVKRVVRCRLYQMPDGILRCAVGNEELENQGWWVGDIFEREV